MPPTPPKPLYIGKSLESLKVRFDILPKNKDISMLCKAAKKLHSEAKLSLRERDEELAYIRFMKYLNVVSYVRKNPDYVKKKDELSNFIPPHTIQHALECAEELSESLKRRYELEYKTNDQERFVKEYDNESKTPSDPLASKISEDTNVNVKLKIPHISAEIQDDHKVNEFEGISSVDLLKHLQADSSRVLIMDVRPSEDFLESHINFDSCISIPEDIVVDGISASKLAQRLPDESKLKWKQRLSVDFLVLMDWFSTTQNPNPDSKVSCLRKILVEWDPSVTYRCKPLLLSGGYDDFLSLYPMKCTNPKPHIPHQTHEDQLSIDDVKYPVFGDESPNPKDASSPSEQSNNTPQAAFSDLDPALSQMSLGSQKSVPSVDRSSKAAALEKYRDLEKRQAEAAEASEELGRNRKVAEEKLSELKKEEKQSLLNQAQIEKLQSEISAVTKKKREVDEENNNLRQELERFRHREREDAARKIPKPNINHTFKSDVNENSSLQNAKSSNKETGSHPDDSSHEPPPSNGKSMPKSSLSSELDVPSTPATFSGLKRSRSSPNIAQLSHDLDSELKSTTPHFDRTTKPSAKNHQNTELISRSRNFHEVYGTVGSGLTGLKNLGNSCYMNSILQCISNTSLLTKYFCSGVYKDHVNKNPSNPTRGEVVEEVAQVVRNLWMRQYRSIACRDLKAVVGQHMNQFRGSLQQDSHEFLTFLLDWLHNDLKVNVEKPPAKVANQTSTKNCVDRNAQVEAAKAWDDFKKYNDSYILTLFFVQQVSTVSCAACSVKSYTYEEPTSNLTLLLPHASRCSLLDCFRLYTNQERISGYKCESCHGSREAEKKIDLCRLPPVLVIHLKRFYSDGFYQKRQTFVDFPLTHLDLREFTLEKEQRYTSYNLYGVSNHYGTLEGGHYTAFCKNGNKWYKFDDQDVCEISPNDVRSPYAYILFYAAV